MTDLTAEQARQLRASVASVRDVLVAAQGVSARGAEVLAGTSAGALMLEIEREIGAFITGNPALAAARAAGAAGL